MSTDNVYFCTRSRPYHHEASQPPARAREPLRKIFLFLERKSTFPSPGAASRTWVRHRSDSLIQTINAIPCPKFSFINGLVISKSLLMSVKREIRAPSPPCLIFPTPTLVCPALSERKFLCIFHATPKFHAKLLAWKFY